MASNEQQQQQERVKDRDVGQAARSRCVTTRVVIARTREPVADRISGTRRP
jgi:hypothetical protein